MLKLFGEFLRVFKICCLMSPSCQFEKEYIIINFDAESKSVLEIKKFLIYATLRGVRGCPDFGLHTYSCKTD